MVMKKEKGEEFTWLTVWLSLMEITSGPAVASRINVTLVIPRSRARCNLPQNTRAFSPALSLRFQCPPKIDERPDFSEHHGPYVIHGESKHRNTIDLATAAVLFNSSKEYTYRMSPLNIRLLLSAGPSSTKFLTTRFPVESWKRMIPTPALGSRSRGRLRPV